MGTARAHTTDLAVFAYGTLKEGFHNHEHYCRGVKQVLPALAWGRLYLWEPGIPIMAVPRERVEIVGSQQGAADLDAAAALDARRVKWRSMRPLMRMWPLRRWRKIAGELLIFPDANERLALLDALEGFNPRPGKRCYERVLMPVRLRPSPHAPKGTRLAWAYVLPQDEDPPSDPLDLSDWQPGRA